MTDFSWLDREAYPFSPHYFDSGDGRMHYIDEGEGKPIVFVHGTSSWSFLYRELIKALSLNYRCIAPDHLGLGLSDKPETAVYHPKDQARRLRAFIEHLGIDRMTLVVHDFGGPIGLAYALDQPQRVSSIVLFNTWMWSLRGEMLVETAGFFGRGQLGNLVFKRLNFELQVLFRMVWGKRETFTKALHRQYLGPFPTPQDRQAIVSLARDLCHAADWYDDLWRRREAIKDIPALLLWGLKDPIFKKKHLARWQELFSNAQTTTFPKAGHFLQEEEAETLPALIRQFLTDRRVDVR